MFVMIIIIIKMTHWLCPQEKGVPNPCFSMIALCGIFFLNMVTYDTPSSLVMLLVLFVQLEA